jgi:hypothetical protein
MKNGIIYQGPSLLDGAPIVVIANYSKSNRKTGGVVQTYILRADMNPLEASKTGADFSICGDCKHKGTPTTDKTRKTALKRTCYVILGQGVLVTYRAFLRGYYPKADNFEARAAIGKGRIVRLGTYGDPAAVPDYVWEQLLSGADSWLAYSHQSGWRADLAMQSADTMAQAIAHWQAGRRTFRVVQKLTEVDPAREVLCPASAEAGRRTTCEACKLCAGLATKSPKSVAIVQH